MTKPAHYDVPIDVITIARCLLTDEEFKGAMKFNALKYFFRQGKKEGSDDTKKCIDYIHQLLNARYVSQNMFAESLITNFETKEGWQSGLMQRS